MGNRDFVFPVKHAASWNATPVRLTAADRDGVSADYARFEHAEVKAEDLALLPRQIAPAARLLLQAVEAVQKKEAVGSASNPRVIGECSATTVWRQQGAFVLGALRVSTFRGPNQATRVSFAYGKVSTRNGRGGKPSRTHLLSFSPHDAARAAAWLSAYAVEHREACDLSSLEALDLAESVRLARLFNQDRSGDGVFDLGEAQPLRPAA